MFSPVSWCGICEDFYNYVANLYDRYEDYYLKMFVDDGIKTWKLPVNADTIIKKQLLKQSPTFSCFDDNGKEHKVKFFELMCAYEKYSNWY